MTFATTAGGGCEGRYQRHRHAAVHRHIFYRRTRAYAAAKAADPLGTARSRPQASADQKAKLPWLKLATFGDVPSDADCLRYNANVSSISGIELDYDGGAILIRYCGEHNQKGAAAGAALYLIIA